MNLGNGFSDANASPAVAVGEGCLHGIGDITSTARGSGARFNSGKPAVDLIPLRLIADSFVDPMRNPNEKLPPVLAALYAVGEFQETGDGRVLKDALRAMSPYWTDCARVFDYGRKKYAAWNWAKGMSWSAVIGCIGRHAIATLNGVQRDPESGELHEGHIACNLVMLATYVDTYPEGNDLPPRALFEPREAPTLRHVGDLVSQFPRRSVVVYGPQACGKTRNAKALAEHFGLSTIVDDWNGEPFPSVDMLVLSNNRGAVDSLTAVKCYAFADAMALMSSGVRP